MRLQIAPIASIVAAAAIATYATADTIAHAEPPLTLSSARITISGTSNVHEYTASTSTVHVTRAQLGDAAGSDIWTRPGGIAAFEVAIPGDTLTSPRDGIDKNMHKALKTTEFADITFSLLRLEMKDDMTGRAVGTLKIAGVEREVTLDMQMRHVGATLAVHGTVTLLMIDYGITPPKAMLGMLKTDPKVTVAFDTVVTLP